MRSLICNLFLVPPEDSPAAGKTVDNLANVFDSSMKLIYQNTDSSATIRACELAFDCIIQLVKTAV